MTDPLKVVRKVDQMDMSAPMMVDKMDALLVVPMVASKVSSLVDVMVVLLVAWKVD